MSQRSLLGANPPFWRRLKEEGEQWLRPYAKPFEARVIAVDASQGKAKVALPGESEDPAANRRPLYPVIGAAPVVGQTAWCLVWFAGGLVITGGGGSADTPEAPAGGLKVNGTGGPAVAPGATERANLGAPVHLTDGTWDEANDRWTATEDGEYVIGGMVGGTSTTDGSQLLLHLWKNGAAFDIIGGAHAGSNRTLVAVGATRVVAAAGDAFQIHAQYLAAAGSASLGLHASYTQMWVDRSGTGPKGDKGDPGNTGGIGPAGPAGINWRGAWSAGTLYQTLDAVTYDGSSWRALAQSAGVTPAEGASWTTIAGRGGPGPTGNAGRTIHTIVDGNPPPASTGLDGDYALFPSGVWPMYGPKAGGAWPQTPSALQGPPGPPGDAPVGAGMTYAAHADPPGGKWMLKDGRELLKTSYPDLNALLSSAGYPYGSTATHFRIPNVSGRTSIGTGQSGTLTNRTPGQTGGEERTVLVASQVPRQAIQYDRSTAGGAGTIATNLQSGTNRGIVLTPTTINLYGNAGGGTDPHENMPPWIAEPQIIRVLP